jgi:transposase
MFRVLRFRLMVERGPHLRPQASEGEAQHGPFCWIGRVVKETRVCIVDDTGKIVWEVKVASEPEALLAVLSAYRFKRIGLEAGPLSQWLFSGVAEAELPVVCVETRHMQAVLKAQINGLKVGMVGTVKFEARIRELVENLPDLAVLVEPLLVVRRALREQFVILHRRLLAIVRDDEVCRRLMTTPVSAPWWH